MRTLRSAHGVEERDIVWLPKQLALLVKDLDDTAAVEREILSYVEQSRQELHSQLETFDADVLAYRANLAKAKLAIKEAQDAHYQETYSLWEEYQKTVPQGKQFVDAAVGILTPLKVELTEINSLLRSISNYDLQQILDLLERIGSANRTSMEMLKFLFENFKREASE